MTDLDNPFTRSGTPAAPNIQVNVPDMDTITPRSPEEKPSSKDKEPNQADKRTETHGGDVESADTGGN